RTTRRLRASSTRCCASCSIRAERGAADRAAEADADVWQGPHGPAVPEPDAPPQATRRPATTRRWRRFAIGARAYLARGARVCESGPAMLDRVKTVFVLMLENRSFDHLFGFSDLTGVDAETGAATRVDGLTGDESNTFDGTRYPVVRGADFVLEGD